MQLGCIATFPGKDSCCVDIAQCKLNTRMIDLRIACPDAGYPDCEARYSSIKNYEQETGNNFYKEKQCRL